MPEPPKITTSLADRIARLNATRSSSGDRNHALIQKEIGEIKSKISKYEESGQHEAPLVPKGSFGLGAPLTKPDRGLDRIRIASSGVSGGMTVSIKPISSPLSSTKGNNFRSVSAGSLHHDRSSSSNGRHSPLTSSVCSPVLDAPPSNTTNPPPTSQRPLSQSSDLFDHPSEDHRSTEDSTQVYDGILDGYPTTPAEEESPPMVTCSSCSQQVELELLVDHVCKLAIETPETMTGSQDRPSSRSSDFPVDVAADSDCSVPIPLTHSDRPQDLPPSQAELARSTCSAPHHNNQSSSDSSAQSEPPVNTPTVTIQEEWIPEPAQEQSEPLPPKASPTQKVDHSPKVTPNRNSDSSHSTNTTRLSAGNQSSKSRRSWYDDDDEGYENSGDGTGFVTIVRSGHR